jgi:hypothetical protein
VCVKSSNLAIGQEAFAQDRPTAAQLPARHAGQAVTRLPSKRVKEKPSNDSRRALRPSRRRLITTSSPSAIELAASDRQWMPAQYPPEPEVHRELVQLPADGHTRPAKGH